MRNETGCQVDAKCCQVNAKSDLISRNGIEKAIRNICNLCGEDKKNNGVMCGACNLDSFIREYDDLPSAEPERTAKVMGEDGDYWHVCNDCDQSVEEEWVYCPFCGKRLEWDDENA